MKHVLKNLFVPKLVDNSPKGWIRLGGQTVVQSLAVNVGVFGGLALVGTIWLKWEEKIKKTAVEEYKKSLDIPITEI